jgi:hypothetical protein
MIAADTSTWIAFFQGEVGEDVELLDRALQDRQVLMSPPVLTELLSDPGISPELSKRSPKYRSSRSSPDFGSELVRFARGFWGSTARHGWEMRLSPKVVLMPRFRC